MYIFLTKHVSRLLPPLYLVLCGASLYQHNSIKFSDIMLNEISIQPKLFNRTWDATGSQPLDPVIIHQFLCEFRHLFLNHCSVGGSNHNPSWQMQPDFSFQISWYSMEKKNPALHPHRSFTTQNSRDLVLFCIIILYFMPNHECLLPKYLFLSHLTIERSSSQSYWLTLTYKRTGNATEFSFRNFSLFWLYLLIFLFLFF